MVDCGPQSKLPGLSVLEEDLADCGPQSLSADRSQRKLSETWSLAHAGRGIVPVIGVRTAVVDCGSHWVIGWLRERQIRTVG